MFFEGSSFKIFDIVSTPFSNHIFTNMPTEEAKRRPRGTWKGGPFPDLFPGPRRDRDKGGPRRVPVWGLGGDWWREKGCSCPVCWSPLGAARRSLSSVGATYFLFPVGKCGLVVSRRVVKVLPDFACVGSRLRTAVVVSLAGWMVLLLLW